MEKIHLLSIKTKINENNTKNTSIEITEKSVVFTC